MAKTSGGTPTVRSAIYNLIREVLESEIETQFQAEVRKFDPATMLASVQGVMRLPNVDGDAEIVVDLEDVPVCFMGSRKFWIYGDITGADVMVSIPKVDSSNYIAGKGRDPEGEKLFSLNGAICTPLAVDHDKDWRDIPLAQAGIRVKTGHNLYLGDESSELVGLLHELVGILDSLTATGGPLGTLGDSFATNFIAQQTAMTVIKNKLSQYKP